MASPSQPDDVVRRFDMELALQDVERHPYRKVPERFRKGNEEFYRPRAVSIGPFHDNEINLRCEGIKLHYRKSFTCRYRGHKVAIHDVANGLGEIAKRYYGSVVEEQSPKDLGSKMMEDGIFLLELMLRSRFPEYRVDGHLDTIFNSTWIIVDVCRDILLIENQLPWTVLEELYKQFVPQPLPDNEEVSLLQLARSFFNAHLFGNGIHPAPTDDGISKVHLVEFVRLYYYPNSSAAYEGRGPSNNVTVELIPPSVTTLYEAGVKFDKLSSGLIEFEIGRLKIPHLDYRTGTFFLNAMAFEENDVCLTIDEKYVSQFMFFMGWMIRTSKDVDILIESGIISSTLGSNSDLVALFDRISKLGWPPENICQELNSYCKSSPSHKWKATLMRDYFDTPWKIASTIAAVILLALTLMQTVCSFLSLKH